MTSLRRRERQKKSLLVKGLFCSSTISKVINDKLEDQLRSIRIGVKRFPSNTTGYLQPMDLSVNSPFKQIYETYWDDYQFDLDSTPSGSYKVPSREGKILWI